jgi:4-amino-4-deoxy-L-arabinose transferase-like glycosyltransferase
VKPIRPGPERLEPVFAYASAAMRAAVRILVRLHVPLLVAASAGLALVAALGDSATIDEPGHLAAGLAAWRFGDFRLAPDHPPLARLWAALPVFLSGHAWPPADAPGWSDGNWFRFARVLFAQNDPQRLLAPARAMTVLLLAATALAIWRITRALFGAAAAGLALALAAFDPGLLAHGHYVTTDLPMTLAALLALGTCARLLRAVTPGRVAAAAAALAAAFLVKLAAVVVLPALAVMAAAAVWRDVPLRVVLRPGRAGRTLATRAGRAGAVAALAAALAVSVWAGLWAGYGFRYAAPAGPGAASATVYPRAMYGPPYPKDMDEAWVLLLRDGRTGRPREGAGVALLQGARRHRALPEAYLLGWAMLGRQAQARVGYLDGEIYAGGRLAYFPAAFLWKTPLPTLLLVALGVGLVVLGRVRVGDPVLAAGLGTFVAAYGLASLTADLNVGHRHLLPLYPALFAIAGAAGAWATTRGRRLGIGLACAGLAASTLAASPHFLGYFNEAAGGWRGGYRHLADSNVDWSQDLLRLRAWMQRHRGEPVALLQSGHAPWPRGLDARPLLSREPDEPAAPLVAGVYAVSANELVGLFKPYQRGETWREPTLLQAYDALWRGGRYESREAQDSFDALRRARLVTRLRARAADERVGASLFLYRLRAAEVDALTRP